MQNFAMWMPPSFWYLHNLLSEPVTSWNDLLLSKFSYRRRRLCRRSPERPWWAEAEPFCRSIWNHTEKQDMNNTRTRKRVRVLIGAPVTFKEGRRVLSLVAWILFEQKQSYLLNLLKNLWLASMYTCVIALRAGETIKKNITTSSPLNS